MNQTHSHTQYLKGKKVTIMGLGLLGKGLGDALFLAKAGAEITITDLKTARELASSIAPLKKFKNVRFVLGKHDFADFEDRDFILKAQGVRLDSPYIAHARARNIPIRMDDELFVSLAPQSVTIIGVTGTRGKTTTASLIYHILKKSGKSVYLGGNIRGVATLSLLSKIKPKDIVVLELSSWQLQGFGEAGISPNISVFTNFMSDHMNYYDGDMERYFQDKAYIFGAHKKGDILIVGETIAKKVPDSYEGTLHVIGKSHVPMSWKLPLAGEHNHDNIAQAVAVARTMKIPLTKIKSAVESFKAVAGRLQYVKKVNGVQIYNDNNATAPAATIAALETFPKGKTVLIMGGADKGVDLTPLERAVNEYTKAVILLPGTGTDKLKEVVGVTAKNLKDAVQKALKVAEKGDIVLFSPALASFGLFKNEYDRNDQFMEIVKKLK